MNNEPNQGLNGARLALLAFAAALAFSGCSSNSGPLKLYPAANPAVYVARQPFGGQMVVDTLSRTDTVVAIDAPQRRIELKHADGTITSYKCGPEIRNFAEMKVGDQVRATVVDEVAVSLRPASASQSITASAAAGAPSGARPGVVNLDTLDYTARIAAIDPWRHSVTLQTADGRTKPIIVGEYINLADYSVGDEVSVRSTQALAVLVEKP